MYFPRLFLLILLLCFQSIASAAEVNVYSYRQAFLLKPVFDAFTEQTGVKVNTVFAKKGLIERMQHEGRNSPADVLLTSDFATLNTAFNAGVTQALDSNVLKNAIPENFRDGEQHWFALTSRARLLVTAKGRMAEGKPVRYEDLADPAYKNRICTRSGKHPYMVALIASMMVHNGDEHAREWLSGMRSNLARKPQGNDRAQVKAISQGECDIAIINSYYMGAMLADEEQTGWANSVDITFPNQDDRGTHMNISGMALTASAPNRDNGRKLMEFMVSDEAQRIYAEQNHEYPVKPGVAASELVQSWGSFMQDSLDLSKIAARRNDASRLVDEVDYDN